MSGVARIRREVRAALELWVAPLIVAALPYRIGVRAARAIARVFPLYAPAADSALRAFASVVPGADAMHWRADYRFHVLLDHADLFWTLLRSRGFFDRLLRGAPALPPADQPLIVLAFHYGQGMALMRWLTAAGRPPRFVSIRLAREDSDSSIAFAYARLRNRTVERVTGQPLILTGGARREIARALGERTTVLGLVDVPLVDSASHAPNGHLLDRPVVLPAGLLQSVIPGTRAIVVSAHIDAEGFRNVQAMQADASSLTMSALADQLSSRLVDAPAAWHFWHLWTRFLSDPNDAQTVEQGTQPATLAR